MKQKRIKNVEAFLLKNNTAFVYSQHQNYVEEEISQIETECCKCEFESSDIKERNTTKNKKF